MQTKTAEATVVAMKSALARNGVPNKLMADNMYAFQQPTFIFDSGITIVIVVAFVFVKISVGG